MGKGEGGALAPHRNVYSVFCISNIFFINAVKSLSRWSIYALLSNHVVSFWAPTGAPPLNPAGGLPSPDFLICSPLEKNPAGARCGGNIKRLRTSVIFRDITRQMCLADRSELSRWQLCCQTVYSDVLVLHDDRHSDGSVRSSRVV